MATVESQLAGNKGFSAGEYARLFGASIGHALRLLVHRSAFRQLPSLFYEGIDPIVHLLLQANNSAIINLWLNHGSKVAFVSSFPRSGNTWMRFLLSDVLLQMHNIETTTDLPVHPNDLIPFLNGNSIARRLARCPDWAIEPSVAFVKTHVWFGQLRHILLSTGGLDSNVPSEGRLPIRDCRVVYLYRSPEDALVSLYHLDSHDPYSRSRARYGIDDFCLKEVSGWLGNVSGYLQAAEDGHPVYFISYERMLEQPAIVLGGLLHWMGLAHDFQMAERAVSNMEFGKLQAMEIQSNKNRSSANVQKRFFRRGGPGSGHAELQESTLREIQDRTGSLLTEANHRQRNQTSEPPAAARSVLDDPGAWKPQQNGHAGLNGHSNRNGGAKESKMLSRLQGM